jgi:hypothetical protein
LDPKLCTINVWVKEVAFQFSLAFKVAIMSLDRVSSRQFAIPGLLGKMVGVH